MKVKTQEEFITQSKNIHNNIYDYSEVIYKNTYTPVTIICPLHGKFQQIPREHLHGHGCPVCGKIKHKDNTSDFIKKSIELYGDKYDYSKVEYTNYHTKVCIICPEHGEFWKTPAKFLSSKQGCPKCSHYKEKHLNSNKSTTEEFVRKAKNVHGNKYDYSKVKYVNNRTKVCIICHEKDENGVEHGEFWQTPSNHLTGNGCRKCADNKYRFTNEWFINKAKTIWGNKYYYDNTKYNGFNHRVIITCPKHGDFEAFPRWFITETSHARGCPKCAVENRIKTTDQFISEAIKLYGNLYDYSKVDYQHGNKKVDIICPKHGVFQTRPNNFLSGHACPECSAEENVKESKLFNNISNYFPNIKFKHIYHNSKILGRQEIDIFDEKHNIGIEYQGDQHFKPIEYFGGITNFNRTLFLDEEKIKKCNINNIILLHFTYNKKYDNTNINYNVYTDEKELFKTIEGIINKGENK